MRKVLFLNLIILLSSYILKAQSFDFITPQSNERTNAVFTIIDGASTSGNSRAPQGSQRYIRTAYLVTSSEMTAAGIPNGVSFNSIGFSYSVAQSVSTSGTFKVYMKNTTDATFSIGTTWGTNAGETLDGMTLACNNTLNIPAATGPFDHTFSGGSSFTYTGGGIYIAFEYQNPSGTLSTSNTALCNTALTSGLRNAYSTTTLPTTLTNTSSFRPVTRLGFVLANDASVKVVHTLGKLPLVHATPHTITAYVNNNGDNTLTNINVTLSIIGANTFSNSKTISSLTSGSGTLVTFDAFSPSSLGTNTVTVSVGSDDNNANNSYTLSQEVTNNSFSLIYGTSITGGVGYNSFAGEFYVKYFNSGTISINQVTAYFSTAGSAFRAKIYDASGTGGEPGASPLWTSSDQTSVTGPNTIAVTPATSITGNYYLAVEQITNSVNMGMGYQTENPIRANTFFAKNTGGTISASSFKFMLENTFTSTLPVALTNFTGSKVGNTNKLIWNTLGEQNNNGFELQRSADALNFSQIHFISSKAINGNSSNNLQYEFIDEQPLKGNNYYRLKQIDKDGKSSNSNVVLIKGEKTASLNINNLYPNPVKDKLNLIISNEKNRKVDFIITDLSGKIVLKLSQQSLVGDSNISLNVEKLSSGSYILKAICDDGCESPLRKFVKQ